MINDENEITNPVETTIDTFASTATTIEQKSSAPENLIEQASSANHLDVAQDPVPVDNNLPNAIKLKNNYAFFNEAGQYLEDSADIVITNEIRIKYYITHNVDFDIID